MVLFCFHYLITSFFLAVWLNGVITPLLIHFLVQMSLFLAGFDITGQESLFWGWQTLVSFIGTLGGVFLVKQSARPRSLLVATNAYSWTYFIGSTAALLASQLLYAHFPPLPTLPSGEAGLGTGLMFMLNCVIIAIIWLGSQKVFYGFPVVWRPFYFTRWLVISSIQILLFYVALSGLDELYVAIISGGSTVVLLWIVDFFTVYLPLKPEFRQAPWDERRGRSSRSLKHPGP